MKTQSLVRSLRELVVSIQLRKQKLRHGLITPAIPPRQTLSQLICETVVQPIVKEVCLVSGRKITFQYGTSTGYFYLLVKYRKFAVLYIPNPASGQIYIKFLNENGAQCMPAKLLYDTDQITEYLNNFNSAI